MLRALSGTPMDLPRPTQVINGIGTWSGSLNSSQNCVRRGEVPFPMTQSLWLGDVGSELDDTSDVRLGV